MHFAEEVSVMIEARFDDYYGETTLLRAKHYGDPYLRFVRFGTRPYDMTEFHPDGAFFIPHVMPISWVCLTPEKFVEHMEDVCRKTKGFFNPPV
jgi:hypothetical protein